MFEALERLLLSKFQMLSGNIWDEEATAILNRIAENPSKDNVDEALTNPRCMECLTHIFQYKFSKVNMVKLQFWITYMDRVCIILQFQRATKRSNLDLHLACLQRMCNLFFAYDHPNYAR